MLPQQDYPYPPQPPLPQAPPPPQSTYRPTYHAPPMTHIVPVPGGPFMPVRPMQLTYVNSAPPPGALHVAPGDPRIGGVLCPVCGGSGDNDNGLLSFFTGPDDCWRCCGSGRVPG